MDELIVIHMDELIVIRLDDLIVIRLDELIVIRVDELIVIHVDELIVIHLIYMLDLASSVRFLKSWQNGSDERCSGGILFLNSFQF